MPAKKPAYPDAVAWAKAGHGDGIVDHCLHNVADAFSAPHGINDAHASWIQAGGHDGDNTHWSIPAPKNVPVYWSGGAHGYGHVAISDGPDHSGRVWIWTTDETAHTHGKFTRVPLTWVKDHWGLNYLGWTETIGGKRIHAHVVAGSVAA